MRAIKTAFFLAWSIVLLSGGSFIGWKAHETVNQVQQNPLSLLGGLKRE